jgi:hypothetical protein
MSATVIAQVYINPAVAFFCLGAALEAFGAASEALGSGADFASALALGCGTARVLTTFPCLGTRRDRVTEKQQQKHGDVNLCEMVRPIDGAD